MITLKFGNERTKKYSSRERDHVPCVSPPENGVASVNYTFSAWRAGSAGSKKEVVLKYETRAHVLTVLYRRLLLGSFLFCRARKIADLMSAFFCDPRVPKARRVA